MASSSDNPNASSRTLVHACCGPCSLEPVRILGEEGVDFALCYCNSNIHPADEHARRLETLREHVTAPQGIELIEGPHDAEEWEREVGVHGTDRESRCRACYRMRFEQTARIAKERGFDVISTTLTISPYQFTDMICEELEAAATRHGLAADARDYRPSYRQATRVSRERGMYRQNYCGCRFSIAEAAAERAAAKERRKAEKELKRRARIALAADGVATQRSQL